MGNILTADRVNGILQINITIMVHLFDYTQWNKISAASAMKGYVQVSVCMCLTDMI